MKKLAVTALLAISGVLIAIASAQPTQSWQPHIGEPPFDTAMWSAEAGSAYLEFPGVSGRLTHNIKDRAVAAHWTTPTGEGAWQTFPVSYFPTAIEGFRGNRVLVAGKRGRSGNTVLELWKVKKPLVLSGPGGAIVQSTTIESIDTLYDDAIEGQDMIRLISEVRHTVGDEALVQFVDSKIAGIVDFTDLNNTTYTPIAGPSPTVQFPIPAMGNAGWDMLTRGNHAVDGQLYFFGHQDPPLVPSILALVDSNRDGVIDSHITISESQWAANYGADSDYLDLD